MKIAYICSSEFLYSTKLSRISISELPLPLRTLNSHAPETQEGGLAQKDSWIDIYFRDP